MITDKCICCGFFGKLYVPRVCKRCYMNGIRDGQTRKLMDKLMEGIDDE